MNFNLSKSGWGLVLSLLFASALLVSVQAQDSSGRSGVQFTCVTWDNLPYEELFYRDGEDGLPISIGKGVRSDPYPLKTQPALQLYIKATDEDGDTAYELVGQAPLASGAERTLFIIEKNEKDSGLPLRVLSMDDSLRSFPMGAFRFVNSTRTSLKVEFGGSTNTVVPNQITMVPANAPKLGGFLPFLVKGMNNKVIFETRLFGQPRGRKMVFILPPSRTGGRVKVRFLPEIIPLPIESEPDTTASE